jgi:phosphoribosylformylglycinamidine synthase subunit PurQ / glutaminase
VRKPRCLILRAAGTNCDEETQYAWELAGAQAERVHINRLIEQPGILSNYQILTVPGGFSYGDDVSAGKILANQLQYHLTDQLREFVSADKLVLGICNGFQVLVKAGLLPGGSMGKDAVTLAWNDSAKFEARWVYLKPQDDRCVFLQGLDLMHLAIAHAEGKLTTRDAETTHALVEGHHVALRYADASGAPGSYPINPNGSVLDAAGLTDATGRVLGMMPHPERFVHRTQHPQWTRLPEDRPPDGLGLFRNAVQYFAA